MGKKDRRRKRLKLSKLLKSVEIPKKRIPIAPPTKVFNTKKSYNRNKNHTKAEENISES